jgi:cholesterol transport system auxiliary component
MNTRQCSLILRGTLLASLCALGGCALFSRGETLKVRYFTLDAAPHSAPAAPNAGAPASSGEPRELRLGRVDASRGLGQEIAVRTGENEVSYREEERWTDRPAQYVRRGLERALFQTRGFTRAYVGDAPTLDVELVELAIVQAAGKALLVRVQLISQLHDSRHALCDETTSLEQTVATDTGGTETDPVNAHSVSALAHLLEQSIEQIAGRTQHCLSAHSQPTPRGDELPTTMNP